MGFFSGIFKAAKKAVKKIVKSPIGKVVLPAAGFALGGPAGAALASGIGTKLSGGSIQDAILSAGLGYAGGSIGGKLFPTTIGAALSPANAVGPYTLSSSLGNFAGNSLGNQIANTSIGSVLGSFAGNSLASGMATPKAQQQSIVSGLSQDPSTAPFKPTRQQQLDLPGSLASLGGLTPEQQSTNIATQGVYGSGQGPQEQTYFQNLINRRLVDDSGKVDQDLSEINPVENSFLSQMGLGGYSNPQSLLEAISKWKAA